MRKTLAISLVLVLLATILFPFQALAAYDKDLEKAINTAKTLLNITDVYDNFTYTINRQNEKTVFNLSWNDTKNRLGNINVTIDSDGKVINYYAYKPVAGRSLKKLPAFSKGDARKIADTFIRKVHPAAWNNLKYQENNSPMNINDKYYRFNYIRVESNIPFPENGINISIDGMTGEVESFNYNWYDDVTFPDTGGEIGMAAAQQSYVDKLGLKLVYKMNFFEQKDQKPYLVYTNVYNNRYLDAKTGDIIQSENYYGFNAYNETRAKMDMGGGLNSYVGASPQPLSPKEQEAVKNAAEIMDQNKAEELARSIFKIGADFKLNYVSLYNNWSTKEDYNWTMEFGKEEKQSGTTQYYNYSVAIDARSGDVVSFYRSQPYDQNSPVKYTEEQSKKIAADFIKTMNPEKFKEAEQTNWSNPIRPLAEGEQVRESYFTFTRKTNNIYFLENGFNITVDNTTGTVTSYNFTWYKKPLPAAEKIIDLNQAHKLLFENVGIQLQYISINPAELYSSKIMPNETQKKEIKLVYAIRPEKPANIDAFTGKILDYNGKPFEVGGNAQYTDIKGNFAERQIKVLAEYGIALPGSQLKPNQNITQREFLYLLLKSTNPYIAVNLTEDGKDDEALYNALTEAGIVKAGEKSPRSVLSRQDAVKFMIRGLNYDKVAEIKGIYALPFKDAKKIKPELYGYMAIAYGLKIIQGNDGYCSPADNLTKAQTYVLLYNFLNVE